MVKISFHPKATEELEASAAWYAERSPNAGRSFCVAIDHALEKIAADPERFVQVDSRHQSCSVINFPFQVVYRYQDERVNVIAIVHAKRRPNYWRAR